MIRPAFRLARRALFLAGMTAATLMFAGAADAQVPLYGANVTLDQARKAMTAAQAEARKNGWPVAIAIVDNAGQLVMFERMDNTQTASVEVAQDKAVSAAMYRRSTKVFQDMVAGAGAGTRALNLRGASTVEGGLPLVVEGKIIGGIGVSGVNSDQDGVVAKAGADAAAAR
ncbi:MAG: heme-binding protein [Rubrivivax sp.]|nr:heme-binding protein [Rubrivivax sp.]